MHQYQTVQTTINKTPRNETPREDTRKRLEVTVLDGGWDPSFDGPVEDATTQELLRFIYFEMK